MAQIRNSDIQKRILEEAKLQASVDVIPTELADKILPVLNVNPKSKKKLLYYKDWNTRNLANNGLYVPAGKKWRIVSAFLKLQTDATVTDRRVVLAMYQNDSADSQICEGVAKTIQPASKVGIYNFMKSVTDSVIADKSSYQYLAVGIPDELTIFEGGNIWDESVNIQVGDAVKWNFIIEEQDILLDAFEVKDVP